MHGSGPGRWVPGSPRQPRFLWGEYRVSVPLVYRTTTCDPWRTQDWRCADRTSTIGFRVINC